MTYYVLFFIEVGSRRVPLGGVMSNPDSCWMEQVVLTENCIRLIG